MLESVWMLVDNFVFDLVVICGWCVECLWMWFVMVVLFVFCVGFGIFGGW